MKKIAIITATRAEYGLFKHILEAIDADEELEYQLIVTGTHLSNDFGNTISEISKDGFRVHNQIDALSKEDTGAGMARYIGNLTAAFADAFEEGKPDIILLLGDRGEMLAGATAASCMNIGILHLHGGETTGNLDNHFRHAISKLAHLHLVATEKNRDTLISFGEQPKRIVVVGAPGLDGITENLLSREDIAARFNLDMYRPIILFVQHPVSTEVGLAAAQIRESLDALVELELQTIIIYPNVDPGGRSIIDAINEYEKHEFIQTHKSLPRQEYLSLMSIASAMVGNSSSGLIEAPAFKLPVLNIGNRQGNREQAINVINTQASKRDIVNALNKALSSDFRRMMDDCVNPFGDGRTTERVIEQIKHLTLNEKFLQKTYGDENEI